MAKQHAGTVKFQVPGGQATPAPPVGTALGRFGINLGQFVQQFNDQTKDAGGMPIPVVVDVYSDRTFEFTTKSPPASALLKRAAGIAKGSGVPNKDKVGKPPSVHGVFTGSAFGDSAVRPVDVTTVRPLRPK